MLIAVQPDTKPLATCISQGAEEEDALLTVVSWGKLDILKGFSTCNDGNTCGASFYLNGITRIQYL